MRENLSSGDEQGTENYFHRASAEDFIKIPTSPIVYWTSNAVYEAFLQGIPLKEIGKPVVGLQTGENARFVRTWQEVSIANTGIGLKSRTEATKSGLKWFPYNKGGDFCRWYGNQDFVVNWEKDGNEIQNFTDVNGKLRSRPQNMDHYFCPSISWSKISSSLPAFRFFPDGFIFDVAGTSIFQKDPVIFWNLLGFCNSKVATEILKALSPTLNFEVGHIGSLPILEQDVAGAQEKVKRLVGIARSDWESYENSWDFTNLPLLHFDHRQPTLKATYQKLRAHWREITKDMLRLEQENNRTFIDAYGLQDELRSDVPLNEITLTCNPHYRYGGVKTDEELEAMLLTDTMRELVSYAVGCMFGRYSLDKQGLILANQGESLADYLTQVPQPSFPADDDNVIPVLDGDWFADDITLRFRQFLRVAFGEAHYEDNLAFVEQALNIKGKRSYTLREYFLGEFYAEHVKRYKKRPIYWLFSSPKGSFNALIYMHRYRPDTVSVVLKYLRDYRDKLVDERNRQTAVTINPASSQGDKTRAQKEVDRLGKVLAELEDYERDVLYPLATEQKPIDLDDGVKMNYLAFGAALKKIPGLEAKEED
jgi:hypothetical protein